MQSVQVSKSLSMSSVVQGFWRLSQWNFSTKELVIFMNACIDRNVTTFDTAEIYAKTVCESLMGDAFRKDPSIRKRIQLVSKTGISFVERDDQVFNYYDTSYPRIIRSCKESLQRLSTDSLDLYLIHREDPCMDVWETARALQHLKQEGLIREVGVSNFDPYKFNALNTAMGGTLVTNQIEWNPVCFEHFNSGMIDLLGMLKIRPMIWSPLAGGRLFFDDPKCESAMRKIREIAERHNVDVSVIVYAWILHHPVGAIPISGSNKLTRLDCAIQALDVPLAHEEWYEIYSASGQQKIR